MNRSRVLSTAFALALALPLAAAGWLAWGVIGFATSSEAPHRGQPVSCTEAMSFADQSGLPVGAYDAKCQVRAWLDTSYDVRFRIGRTDLRRWMHSAYPGTELEPSSCPSDTADVCAHIELDPPAKGGAVAIDMAVEFEKGSTTLVRFEPFDV